MSWKGKAISFDKYELGFINNKGKFIHRSDAVKELSPIWKETDQGIAGLQNAIVDDMLSSVSLEGRELLTSKQMKNQLVKYDAALKVVFKNSPEKMTAMRQVRRAVRNLERSTDIPKSGIDRAENIITYLARRHGFSRRAVVNIAAAAIQPLKQFSDKQVHTIINRALLDPDLAFGFAYTARGGAPKKATRHLINNLATLALIGQKEPEHPLENIRGK